MSTPGMPGAERGRVALHPGEGKSRLGLLFIAALLGAGFSFAFPNFATVNNANSILLASSTIVIAAVGTCLLLLLGKLDFSIGGIYAVCGVTTALAAAAGAPPVVAAVVGVVAGMALGLINGLLVRLLSISPVIVTVATMIIYEGLAFVLSGGNAISRIPPELLDFGRSSLGPVRTPIILALLVFVVFALWLTRTNAGLSVYATGGNKRAAELIGIGAERLQLTAYGINGALVGFAAVLTTSRLGIGSPGAGQGLVFDVITAVILGGIAFNGGAGRPLGVLYGIAAIGILNAGFVFAGIPLYYQTIAKGVLLLSALAADQVLAHRARAASARGQLRKRKAQTTTSAANVRSRRKTPQGMFAQMPILKARGLTKRYGAVIANDAIDLDVRPGEIVCLIDDNGAGKSTLVKMLAGAIQSDEGSIEIDVELVGAASPARMRTLGLETVYQDLALFPNLSVAHNLSLGQHAIGQSGGRFWRDDREAIQSARVRLSQLGVNLPSEATLISDLSGGQRQCVAIARSLHEGVKVIMLDEPTAALGVHQTAAVLDLIERTAASGAGVILISHDIETVLRVADRVVVLRLGQVAYEGPTSSLSELDLIHLMAGISDGPENAQ